VRPRDPRSRDAGDGRRNGAPEPAPAEALPARAHPLGPERHRLKGELAGTWRRGLHLQTVLAGGAPRSGPCASSVGGEVRTDAPRDPNALTRPDQETGRSRIRPHRALRPGVPG